MKKYKDFWWPDDDKHCHPVIPREVDHIKLALKHVKKRRVCVQAGGNVGVWPKKLIRYFDKVITFEPQWENFECLCRNLENEMHVTKIQAALSNDPKPIQMTLPPKEAQNYGAFQIENADYWGIPALCLDSLHLPILDFLCLDIEGAEWLAIQGGLTTIRKCLPVIMVEDKGLGLRYGVQQNHIATMLKQLLRYSVVETIHGGRDQILVPTDASELSRVRVEAYRSGKRSA